MFHDISYSVTSDGQSLAERQAFMLAEKMWKHHTHKPLKVHDLKAELEYRGEETKGLNGKELKAKFDTLRKGIAHFLARIRTDPEKPHRSASTKL